MAGSIVTFFGEADQIPFGYLPCDGTFRDGSIYVELFKKIGYFYGRDGDLFRLPCLANSYISSTLFKEKSGVLFPGVLKSHKHEKYLLPKSGAHRHGYWKQIATNYFSGGSSGRQAKYFKASDYFQAETVWSSRSGGKQGVHSNHPVVIEPDGDGEGVLKSMCVQFLIEF